MEQQLVITRAAWFKAAAGLRRRTRAGESAVAMATVSNGGDDGFFDLFWNKPDMYTVMVS